MSSHEYLYRCAELSMNQPFVSKLAICLIWLASSSGNMCVLVLALITAVVGKELKFAHRSPSGSALCPLVEDFYSYTKTAIYGPSRWAEMSPCCLGSKQSPRDLSSHAPSLCWHTRGFPFFYNSSSSITGHLYNTGHYPKVSFTPWDTILLLNAPYAREPYVLASMHIHFCTDQHGSEHAIDGRFFQGEIHLVHYKVGYGSVAKAVLHDDGLVVIGIMLQTIPLYHRKVNYELHKLITKMVALQGVGKDFKLSVPMHVTALLPSFRGYYTYHGSLTSPPCSESVRWIVLRQPIYVTIAQMNVMRRLPNENPVFPHYGCNDRPLQKGNTPMETNRGCVYHRVSPGS